MAVREFKLVNEKGQEFSLMDIENFCLLTEIAGLGISYNVEYERVGNTYVANSKISEQGKPSGVANFKNYDNYNNFINFVNTSENIKLYYKIPFKLGAKEYLRDVIIQALDKTEVKTTGVISEGINFECLSLWYEEKKAIYKIQPESDEIKWDFKWNSKFANHSAKLPIINQGHVEAPILVEMGGPLKNPTISLYIDGELYQKVKINIEIAEYEKLLYGTKENEFYINKQNEDGTLTSLFSLDYIDFYNDNVIRIPQNRSCELRLTADNEVLNALVTVLIFYKAV